MSERLKKFLSCPHRNVQQFTECCLDCGENIYQTPAQIQKEEQQKKSKEKENWNENGW